MDPDGGEHTHHIPAEFENHVSPIPCVLPLEGWTSCLKQLPPFSCGGLYARLVTDSKTIAENQQCTAAVTFGAGTMKHKTERYL